MGCAAAGRPGQPAEPRVAVETGRRPRPNGRGSRWRDGAQAGRGAGRGPLGSRVRWGRAPGSSSFPRLPVPAALWATWALSHSRRLGLGYQGSCPSVGSHSLSHITRPNHCLSFLKCEVEELGREIFMDTSTPLLFVAVGQGWRMQSWVIFHSLPRWRHFLIKVRPSLESEPGKVEVRKATIVSDPNDSII